VTDSPELNLARRIVSILPPFSPSSSRRVTNQQCLRESQYYLQELDNFALWALKSEYLINLPKSEWLLYVPPILAPETLDLTRRIYAFRVVPPNSINRLVSDADALSLLLCRNEFLYYY
jgi:hypothetical protein